MRTSFRQRQRAHRAFEDVCTRHRRTVESSRGGRNMLARLRKSIKSVDVWFTRHLAAVKQEIDLAHDRKREYEDIRTAFLHIAQFTRIAVRDGKISIAAVTIPRVGSTEFLSKAEAILRIVSPHADVLEEYGLPAHVLQDMPRRLAAFRQSEADQFNAKTTHMFANAAIREALRDGDDAVVGLEANLRAMPGGNPKIVAELREAKRVGRKRSSLKRSTRSANR